MDQVLISMKEESNRRIAAITFNDIVSYTAMMKGDEDAAAKVRRRHRMVIHSIVNR